MLKKTLWTSLVIFIGLALFLVVWPVPIDPVAWKAPPNPGYTGPFASNELLKDVQILSIGDNQGPEDIALDDQGRIYASTQAGYIVRLKADGSNPENWVHTGGRPLGIDFDHRGNLIIADALRGLLSIDPNGNIKELASTADGTPICYADDVDVAADGKIYFSDASTKFGAKASGGTYEASLLDLMEHGGYGRLLVYDPVNGRVRMLLDKLNFANGVAVSHDQTYVLVNETGSYRVLRYWLTGANQGQVEPFVEGLPGFPDNVSTGAEGRFWVALVSPRNALLDHLSDKPFLRKLVQRFPAFMRPKAKAYGHIIAVDGAGQVVKDLQDPRGTYPLNTSVTENEAFLYLGSLVAPGLGRLSKKTGW